MGKKNITTWMPDSCGCIVEYSWDSDSDEDSRVHTFVGHSKKCNDHEHLWDKDVYDTVIEENQRKNITLQHAVEHTPLGQNREVKDRNNRLVTTRQLRPDVQHNFFFTHQDDPLQTSSKKPRVLHLSFSEQIPEHKQIVEQRFPGLVKVH